MNWSRLDIECDGSNNSSNFEESTNWFSYTTEMNWNQWIPGGKKYTNIYKTEQYGLQTVYISFKVYVVNGPKYAKELLWSFFKTASQSLKHSYKWHWRTTWLCLAAVSPLLDVCDLCVADGAGLPLSSEHWTRIRHSGKKSDNLLA